MKYSEYKNRLKEHKRLAKEHKVKMFYAKVSATILTLMWLVLVVVVIAAFTGCADKPAVVYKTKEVNIPVRCDIEMPALPNIENKQADEVATEIAKSFDEHRQALRCCIYGLCKE